MGRHLRTNRDDGELFRRAVGDVQRLPQDRVEPARRRPRPIPVKGREEDLAVLAEMAAGSLDPAELETGEELVYRGEGLQERQFRRLRRGQFAIEAELDLHGMAADAAREAVSRFLTGARLKRQRCVRIIHGKGHGSRGGQPVIKTRLPRWLRQRADVLGYCSAPAVDGGTGALYVLIRRPG